MDGDEQRIVADDHVRSEWERRGHGRLTASANTSGSARTATLTIGDQIFTVTEAGTPCSYAISATTQSLAFGGGTGSVSVTSPSGCGWTATSSAAWLTLTSGTSGSGTGVAAFSAVPNTGTSARVATLTVAGQTMTVTQAGQTCTYSISSTSQALSSSGGTASVMVTAPSGCAWTAVSGAAWLTVGATASGAGSDTVVFTASPNSGPSARTTTLTIAGQTVTITQDATSCSYLIDPVSLPVSARSR